jgi:Protein of unknown function (DUF4231)
MAEQTISNEGSQFVSDTIVSALMWSLKGQKWWSVANHGSTICIVVFSAVAAVLSQVGHNSLWSIDATILSLCVTIVSTVQSKLGFERKWITNRMTQSSLRQLEIDEKTRAIPPQEVVAKLKTILETHDKAITATGSG